MSDRFDEPLTDRQWSIRAFNHATKCIAVAGEYQGRINDLEADLCELRGDNKRLRSMIDDLRETVDLLVSVILEGEKQPFA